MKKSLRPLPYPLPAQLYLKCIDDQRVPAGYVGDWPVAGEVYRAQVVRSRRTGRPQVRLEGFHAEKPWGAFAPERFVGVARVWLN